MWCWILWNRMSYKQIPSQNPLSANSSSETPRQAPRLWRLTCQPHTRRRGLIWWGQQAMQILEGSCLRIMFAHDVEISWKIFWLQHPHLFCQLFIQKAKPLRKNSSSCSVVYLGMAANCESSKATIKNHQVLQVKVSRYHATHRGSQCPASFQEVWEPLEGLCIAHA